MSGNLFIPKMKHVEDGAVLRTGFDNKTKVVETHENNTLIKIAQYVVVAMFGFLPIYFTPHLWASLGFDKAILVIVLGAVAIILLSFQALRQTHAHTVLPLSLGLYWLMVIAATISAFLTGNVQQALRGSMLETQTVAFLAVIGLMMSLPLVFQRSKEMTLKAVTFFGATASLLLLYNVVRIFVSSDFLNFQSFGSVTFSPVGGFNDLAIFCGVVIIFGLITLMQLPLRTSLQYFISGLIFVSLALLAVVNFFTIWVVIGFFSFLALMYLLTKDTIFKTEETIVENRSKNHSQVLLIMLVLVCVASVMFIVAGGFFGEKISQMTGVNYVEVRPSILATVNIARSVFADNVLLGVGPNRFASAWRQYKDPSINETQFWDTEFIAGSGFVPTLFISLGLLGGVLMLVSHIAFLYLGYRMFLKTKKPDFYWYYLGLVSFASATFVWVMSYVYVPGATILLVGAFFTGLTFVASGALLPNMVRSVPLVANRRRGFMLMAIVILVVVCSVSMVFKVGEQYVAAANFNEANATATVDTIPLLNQTALNSFNLYKDGRFISTLAQIQLFNLNRLINIAEPTEADLQEFSNTSGLAIGYARDAVATDTTNPIFQIILARVYNSLALAGVDGAKDLSAAALAEAMRLDSLNPGYHLIAAQIAAEVGDVTKAREEIKAALNLKRNYTEALFLSAQLDIEENKAESAIATTRSIITLEPNNPTRYFQLGILLAANNNQSEAEIAFKTAISIDSQYANAHYMLALLYLNTDKPDLALEHLKIVQVNNQENTELNDLIKRVESGDYKMPQNNSINTPVSERSPAVDSENNVTTNGDTNTDLVKPVNTVSGAGQLTNSEETAVVESNEIEEDVEVPAE